MQPKPAIFALSRACIVRGTGSSNPPPSRGESCERLHPRLPPARRRDPSVAARFDPRAVRGGVSFPLPPVPRPRRTPIDAWRAKRSLLDWLDENVFEQIVINDFGAVCWPTGHALGPDIIYNCIKR